MLPITRHLAARHWIQWPVQAPALVTRTSLGVYLPVIPGLRFGCLSSAFGLESPSYSTTILLAGLARSPLFEEFQAPRRLGSMQAAA